MSLLFTMVMVSIWPLAAVAQEVPDRVRVPDPDRGFETLEARGAIQKNTAFEVRTDLRFTDSILGSGIDFVHRSVSDSLQNWMPVHYDHGNGVAAADIDGDSRYDVYLTSQLGGNGLYRNLGEGRFENVTQAAGVALAARVGVTASFADFDNDGDPDLFVTTVRGGNVLYENDGTGRFTDITQAAGLSYTGHSSGAVFFDYDNDGFLDLFLTNVGTYTTEEKGEGGFYRGIDDAFKGHLYPERSEQSILYRNIAGGRFEDVSAKTGLNDTSWSGDATAIDLNRDGFTDLYVLNMQGDDHYYENVNGERFVDKTAATFPKTSWGAMGVKFFDYNNNGRMDLIVTDMHSDMHGEEVNPLRDEKTKYQQAVEGIENNLLGNAFYEQQDDGSFLEISDLIRVENYWPWGLSVGDLNADGFEDVFITTSMNFPFRYQVNSVLLNNQALTFLDSEFLLGFEPRRGGRTHKDLFELDCGGLDHQHKLCAGRSETITVEGSLGSRSSVIFDLDGDGDQDVLTNEFNDVPQLLISDLASRGGLHYLEVKLRGTESNRDGLGARVELHAGEDVYTKIHDGKSGYLSQSSLPLYFGLGEHSTIDRIVVRWPSGTAQVVEEGLEINRLVEIVEEVEEDSPREHS